MNVKIKKPNYKHLTSVTLIVGFLALFALQSANAASRCSESWYRVKCSYNVTKINSSALTKRDVYWQVPNGTPPADGWPVALIYQGTAAPVQFERTRYDAFGLFYEAKTIKRLLDSGYAVLAPRAAANVAWHTNLSGIFYKATTDYSFFNNLFDAIDDGVFGNLDGGKKFATGISSGGYNTSRMAVTWPYEFKALVVHSASYATCAGILCVVPKLDSNHPPTAFVHGLWDPLAPWVAMDQYYDRLQYDGIPTKRLNFNGGHGWSSSSAKFVVDWFNKYR